MNNRVETLNKNQHSIIWPLGCLVHTLLVSRLASLIWMVLTMAVLMASPAQALDCTVTGDTSAATKEVRVDVDGGTCSVVLITDPSTPYKGFSAELTLGSVRLSAYQSAGQPSSAGVSVVSATPPLQNIFAFPEFVFATASGLTRQFRSTYVVDSVTYTLVLEWAAFQNDDGSVSTLQVMSARVFGGSFGTETPPSDNTPPTLSFSDVPSSLPDTSQREITINFDEPVFGFALRDGDVVATNASLGTHITLVTPTEFKVQYTPNGSGDVMITVPGDAVQDSAGNGNVGNSITIPYGGDSTAPQVSDVSATPNPVTGSTTSVDVIVLFDETMNSTVTPLLTFTEDVSTVLTDAATKAGSWSSTNVPNDTYTVTYTVIDAGVDIEDVGVIVSTSFVEANDNPLAAAVTQPDVFDILQDDNSNAIIQRTSRIIQNFMSRRADQITANEPDLSSRLNRGGGGGDRAGSLTGQGDLVSNNELAFSTSLSQMAAWRRAQNDGPVPHVGGLPVHGENTGKFGFGAGDAGPAMDIDIWLKGKLVQIDNATASSVLGLVHAGVDYAVNPDLVVGFMAQLDIMDEEDNTQGFTASGTGWLAGPYVVHRLMDNLVLDARAAWGTSDNKVSPYNTYEDGYDTERWLVAAKLTGDFDLSGVTVAPHVGVIYFQEDQKAYTDSNALTIPGQTVALGRLTFGPKLTWNHIDPDGITVAVHWAASGIWDFETADLVSLDTGLAATGTTDLRARTEAGFTVHTTNGVTLGIEGFYDGIGADDFDVYGGAIKVAVPLN